ncbi:MAG: hypothetical protein FWB96_00320 [Defluviitaleaceae bacterium]|nr:hypothetical protein [Defluviitaleaceae bacterium]MCL2261844.1 hypothetical protein [Defluviitaleaceae bacterium]
MKKVLCLVALLLVGCASGAAEISYEDRAEAARILAAQSDRLDFTSIRDMAQDVVISLGDRVEDVTAALGEPISVTNLPENITGEARKVLSFSNGMYVRFYDGAAGLITGRHAHDRGRFEILGYSPEMNAQQVAVNFDKHPQDSGEIQYIFTSHFDPHGEKLTGYWHEVSGGSLTPYPLEHKSC